MLQLARASMRSEGVASVVPSRQLLRNCTRWGLLGVGQDRGMGRRVGATAAAGMSGWRGGSMPAGA